MRPGLTVYKQIFFPDNIYGVMFNGKLPISNIIQNPAVLLFHKFSTELTELVNQQIIFMKTTFKWVVGYIIKRFGDY